MLLKKTQSLCPICRKVLDAEIFDEDGKVWIRRTCPDHGEAKNLYWSDVGMYRRFDAFERIGNGITTRNSMRPPKPARLHAGSVQTIAHERFSRIST